MQELCILIPTFERYRPIAEFTRGLIDECWRPHPPIFFCGLSGDSSSDVLPRSDDSSDWMATVRAACAELRQRGFRKCYLVLDDHPPLGVCHATHLNTTLPALLEKLGALVIHLAGWGQHKPSRGVVLDRAHGRVERSSIENLWKFSLHPALWDLDGLIALLDLLMKNTDLPARSPWSFERRGGAPDAALPEAMKRGSYRVFGAAMSARRGRTYFHFARWTELFAFDVLRFFVRVLAGDAARERFDARVLGLYHFYDGPYPLFWSGLMKKGALNQSLLFFLKFHNRPFRDKLNLLTLPGSRDTLASGSAVP